MIIYRSFEFHDEITRLCGAHIKVYQLTSIWYRELQRAGEESLPLATNETHLRHLEKAASDFLFFFSLQPLLAAKMKLSYLITLVNELINNQEAVCTDSIRANCFQLHLTFISMALVNLFRCFDISKRLGAKWGKLHATFQCAFVLSCLFKIHFDSISSQFDRVFGHFLRNFSNIQPNRSTIWPDFGQFSAKLCH